MALEVIEVGDEKAPLEKQAKSDLNYTPYVNEPLKSEPDYSSFMSVYGPPTAEAQQLQQTYGNQKVTSMLQQHMNSQAAGAAANPGKPRELISQFTSWIGNLDEEGLGAELLQWAARGQYQFVQETLDQLGSTDRDDVALAIMQASGEEVLRQMANAEEGRRLLDRMFDDLTSGEPDEEEKKQADRIIHSKTLLISPEQMAKVDMKIFPFSLPGMTHNGAPMTARRLRDGNIYIKMPVHVLGNREYREETKTLPASVFAGGLELPENEMIGVRMYDEGKAAPIIYKPALFLVQLANESTTQVAHKMAEVTAIGLSLGVGEFAAVGAEAAMGTRALLWADRIATATGILASVVTEHRGFIIDQFGDKGRQFLDITDRVNQVVAIYGITRGSVGVLKQFGSTLRSAHKAILNAAYEARMANEELSKLQRITVQVEGLLQKIDNMYEEAATTGARFYEQASSAVQGAVQETKDALSLQPMTSVGVPMPVPDTPMHTGVLEKRSVKGSGSGSSGGRGAGGSSGPPIGYVRTGPRLSAKKFEPFIREAIKDEQMVRGIQNVEGKSLPKMTHTSAGQFNRSGNGVDIFGVDESGDLWIIEVSVAETKELRNVKYAGADQMTESWRKAAVNKFLEKDTAIQEVRELFPHWGSDLSDEDVKFWFRSKASNGKYAFVVPEGSTVRPNSSTEFIARDVYTYHFSNEDMSPLYE